jgi:thioredoxin-dependent peroxiredoxin
MRRPMTFMLSLTMVFATAGWSMKAVAQVTEAIKTLKLGETAKDVEFQPLKGEKIKLSELTEQGPVVLVVLRGYPGYQCPACSRQVAELRKHAEEFKKLGAKVVLVYPGPAEQLQDRAKEFLEGKQLPDPLLLVVDPNYAFVAPFGLRWNAPRETAYPSTFVFNKDRKVTFRKVSRTHGDRAKTQDVLEALINGNGDDD